MVKRVRVGWRYRIVTVAGLMWNSCGCFDYALLQSRNDAYLARLPEALPAYLDSLPGWVEAAWATGVWGALVGSLLMVLRSRFAVPAFALALAGFTTYIGYQVVMGLSPMMKLRAAMGFTAISWFVLAYLLLYALRCWRRILR